MSSRPAETRATLSMPQVLLCGAAVVTVWMGIRHGFGLWLQPVTMDRGWSRETFAFALALQNLAVGWPAVALCDVRGVDPDAVTVDALARLQLAARRHGCEVRLRNASPALLELVELMGLTDVLGDERFPHAAEV